METNTDLVKTEVKVENELESTVSLKPESDCEFATCKARNKEENR
jgi:hypothetical protein